jgi:hypothetical protein
VSRPVQTEGCLSVQSGGSMTPDGWTDRTPGQDGEGADCRLLHAQSVAFELVRTALVAKLAVDLGDPVLARRAARYAQSSARLVAGLDFPAHVESDDDQALPEVDDLLERMPSRAEVQPL